MRPLVQDPFCKRMDQAISTAKIHPLIMTEVKHPETSINKTSKIPVKEAELAVMEEEQETPQEWTTINVKLPIRIILPDSNRTMAVNSSPRCMNQTLPLRMKMLWTRNQVDMIIWDILQDPQTSKVRVFSVNNTVYYRCIMAHPLVSLTPV